MRAADDMICSEDLGVFNEDGVTGGKLAEVVQGNFGVVIFWVAAVFVLFYGLGVKEIWGPEDRWAEIVREMRLTGDYFHPRINGLPYFDKPLLSYWLIAAVSAVTGRLDEMALRFPSAVAGLASLWGTMNLARRLFSKQAAVTAGWILLGSYGFVFWARTGEADMENLAAIVLAVAWYWARRDKPGFVSYLIFYLICFVGAHTKGMATIAIPMIVVLPDMLRERRWRSYISFSNFLALIIGLCVYLAPFLYSDATRVGYRSSGLWFAFRENITRYFKPFDHKEPWYVYFYYLPKLFFPWIVLLVGAIWTCIENFRKLDWPTRWLCISTLLIFLFFTFSGSRRSYYVLPVVPFCALMVSQYLAVEPKEQSRRIMLSIQGGVLFVLLGAEILSPLIWPYLAKSIAFTPPEELKTATLIIGLLAMTYYVFDRIAGGVFAKLLGTDKRLTHYLVLSVIVMGGFFLWQERILENLRSMKTFSVELKEPAEAVGNDNIVIFKNFPPKMIFHLDKPVPIDVIADAKALKSLIATKTEPWIVVSHSKYLDELATVLGERLLNEPSYRENVYPWENRLKKYQAWIINGDKAKGERLRSDIASNSLE